MKQLNLFNWPESDSADGDFEITRKSSRCPTCGQNAKIYSRPLNWAQVLALVLINRYRLKYGGNPWVHVENLLKNTPDISATVRGDASKLRFYGLTEKKIEDRQDESKRNGYYRITELGIDFLAGNAEVRQRIVTYNHLLLDFEGPWIKIYDTKTVRFNFKELMESSRSAVIISPPTKKKK